MDANPETGATDVDGAAKRLRSLFNAEQSGLSPSPKQDVEKESQQPEAKTEAETSQDDTQAEEPRYKVKVNGEEKEVTIEDLRKGYMMESDYRQKTSQVAEQRKAVEAKAQEIEQQLAEAKELLSLDIENLNSPEMQQMKEIYPAEYYKEVEKVEKKKEKFEKLKAKREAEQQERQRELHKKEYEALTTAIPEWLDESVRDKEATDALIKLKGMGFSDAELFAMTDHRMFLIGKELAKVDKISKQNIDAKKVKTPPKVIQPGTSTEKTESDSVKSKRDALRRSGSIDAAADLFRSFMK